MANEQNLKSYKPGESGNPEGRPKGSVNRSTIAKKVLSMQVQTPQDLYDHFKELYPDLPKMMSIEEVTTLAIVRKAMKRGDHLRYKAIMDSAYGAPKQEVEHSGEVEIGFDLGKISDADLKTILDITSKAKDAK